MCPLHLREQNKASKHRLYTTAELELRFSRLKIPYSNKTIGLFYKRALIYVIVSRDSLQNNFYHDNSQKILAYDNVFWWKIAAAVVVA